MDFDPEQLQKIMSNLLSNAIKFTPSGGSIQVSLRQNKKALNIEVKDTGIGIGEQDLPYVFDRFYQVDGSTTRMGEGTGIGLAHALELTKLMEGSIVVESELGKGTVFLVTLPIMHRSEKQRMRSESKLMKSQLPLSDTKLINVNTGETSPLTSLPSLLIIEDNLDVVTYLQSCLKSQYQIKVAFNGRIGIELALEKSPDLIISDVMMPEKDGFEVCDTLKADERTSHIPIILLTAKADMDSKLDGLSRGADAYLAKPFVKEELMVRLEMMQAKQLKLRAYFSKTKTQNKTVEVLENTETVLIKEVVEKDIEVEDAFVKKLRLILEENYSDEHFALPQLCQKVGMSRFQLFRKMKALLGTSPSDYIRNFRMEKAKTFLETTDLTVGEVAWKVGFKDSAHFSKTFQTTYGHPPSATSK